jgi:hypothetical protein
MSDRTTYARAIAGYDEAHERELVEAITAAIAEASKITDANVIALRTGEISSALLTCLAGILAVSPSVTRSPTAMRKLIDELGKRLRLRVNRGQQDADAFRRRCFNGNDVEGNA